MRRTVNQTGRKKIFLELLEVLPKTEGAKRSIYLKWDLRSLELDSDDELFIEVDSFASSNRLAFGKVADGTGSFTVDLDYIQDLRVAKLKMFTVAGKEDVRIITSTTTSIPVVFDIVDADSTELLKVQKIDELDTLWKVDYYSGEPILQICNRNGLYPSITQGPLFFAAILPAVVKEIAYKVFSGDPQIQEETLSRWKQYFLYLGLTESEFRELTESDYVSEEDLVELRMDKAHFLSERFSVNNRMIERLLEEAASE